ncbi:MAG: hypothetical protein ACI8ZN_000383 [Bacteroidia bacterium]|jgi:hypothetical protein
MKSKVNPRRLSSMFRLVFVGFIFLSATVFVEKNALFYKSSGTMTWGNYTFDSLFPPLKINPLQTVLFEQFDSVTSAKLSKLHPQLSNYLLRKDKVNNEYFYLFNGSKKEILVSRQNEKIVAVELAQTLLGYYQPTCFFQYPSCGTGINYTKHSIEPGGTLVFYRAKRHIPGHRVAKASLRLETSDGILVSKQYQTTLNENTFYIHSDYREQIESSRSYRQITFLGK